MDKELSDTRPGFLWHAERGYYLPGSRRFVDLKVGIAPDAPVMSLIPRPASTGVLELLAGRARNSSDNQAPQVARVLRAVTEDTSEKDKKNWHLLCSGEQFLFTQRT